jgi:hypothetical protein
MMPYFYSFAGGKASRSSRSAPCFPKESVPDIGAGGAEPVVVGATIPGEAETLAVPEAWGSEFRPYHYAYADNCVSLVEPTSRRVVYIID